MKTDLLSNVCSSKSSYYLQVYEWAVAVLGKEIGKNQEARKNQVGRNEEKVLSPVSKFCKMLRGRSARHVIDNKGPTRMQGTKDVSRNWHVKDKCELDYSGCKWQKSN